MTWPEAVRTLRELAGSRGWDDRAQWPWREQLLRWLELDRDPPLEEVRNVLGQAEAHAPLTITALEFCRSVQGFGNFRPIASAELKPGAEVLLYCELIGLRIKPAESPDRGYRTKIESSVQVLDSSDQKVRWSEDLGQAEDVCRQPRRDYFVNYRLTLPRDLPPGSYELRLNQRDLFADQTAALSIPFRVVP